MPILYGASASPFVRKAMLAHAYKDVSYELKMTPPGSNDGEFRQASPSGKIPGYKTDDGTAFADSSVIIAYLERTSSKHNLYPENASYYAQALWFEEWSDSELMPATGALYFQRVLGPIFFKKATEPKRVEEILTELIPKVLDLLEARVSDKEWLIGNDFSVADIAVGSCLISLQLADYQIEQSRWPKLYSYNERFLALPIAQEQMAIEQTVIDKMTG